MANKTSVRLREALARGHTIFRPGIALAVHAQMAEALGFEAVGISTGNLASQVYGLPDVGMLTLTEVAYNVRCIAQATNIPTLVDCDTGFGNALGVRRTVSEIIAAGAAALFFEDQESPKRCGSASGARLLPLDEAVGKFASAVTIRDQIDPDFVLMARTDARSAEGGGIEEAVRRAKAYRAAGVDIVHVENLRSRDEIKLLRNSIDGYFTCSANSLHLTLDEMNELGMCMTMGTMFFKAGLVAAWDLLADMKQNGLAPFHDYMKSSRNHPMGGVGSQQLAGLQDMIAWEERFVPGAGRQYEGSETNYDPRTEHSPLLRRN